MCLITSGPIYRNRAFEEQSIGWKILISILMNISKTNENKILSFSMQLFVWLFCKLREIYGKKITNKCIVYR